VDPPAQKFVDDSASDEVTQEQPIGQSQIALNLPSLRNTVSPSPPPTPQTPSQKVDYRSDLVPPDHHGGSAETEESRNERPDVSSKETLQHPPPDAGDNRSESDSVSPENRDGSARIDEGPNDTSHTGSAETLQDHPSRADYDSPGSRTDLQDTLSSGNASGVSVSDEESGGLSVRELVFAVAEIGVGSDLNRGSDSNDEEEYRPKTRQDDSETSGTLLVPILPTRTLHPWRFWSECRRRKPPKRSRSKPLRCIYLSSYIPDVCDTPGRDESIGKFIPKSRGTARPTWYVYLSISVRLLDE